MARLLIPGEGAAGQTAALQAKKRLVPGTNSSSPRPAVLRGFRRHQGCGGTTRARTCRELGPRGITLNVVSPGPTETDLFKAGEMEEQIQQFGQAAALGRLGQPAEIAQLVAFQAADAAGWTTGHNIRVNGGNA